jgi:hypothetical protein
MTRTGIAFRLPPSAPLTDVTGSFSWPTPTATDAKGRAYQKRPDGTRGVTLVGAVRMWPTPTARLGTPRGAQAARYSDPRRSNDLDDAVAASGHSGPLNPTWVEWLMGFPLGWTDSEASATPSSPKSESSSAA